MKRISEYKELARQSMRGSYGQGVIVMLGVVMAQSVLSGVFSSMIGDSMVLSIAYNILNLIIATIIFNPLLVGLSRFFLEQAQGRPDMNNVFYPFKTNLTNTVKVMLIRDVKLILWMLPAIVLAFAATAFLGTMDSAGNMTDETLIVWFPLVFIAFMIPGIIKSIEYSIINFIIADNPDTTSKEAFKMAREMMKGNKRRLFLLELSFIGWYFVGMLLFFVGIFFVAAYTEAATAQFYLDVKAHSGYGNISFTEKYDIDRIDDGDSFGI